MFANIIAIIAIVILGAIWFWIHMSIEGRFEELPTITKIIYGGDLVIIVVLLVIIAKFNLWC